MFNPDIQYRCTIIRGKAQKELDNLLPAYASIINEICPCNKEDFDNIFNERLSQLLYNETYIKLSLAHQKTIRNHITEIAGKLFALYFKRDNLIYESDSNKKLIEDSDQPAFFKNLCFRFQFPNGTQKINTIKDRIFNRINVRPFHFLLSCLKEAKTRKMCLTKNEIGYYILNAKQVLQGSISNKEVINVIDYDRKNGIIKKLENTSRNMQHINEQINLLELSNLIFVKDGVVYLNENEEEAIESFIKEIPEALSFNFSKYNLSNKESSSAMYDDWAEYFGQISFENISILKTNIKTEWKKRIFSGINRVTLGDQGEEYVFNFEKERVSKIDPKLAYKVQLLGKVKGLGYDILSVEADEDFQNPETLRFIEVKSTIRTTTPDLDNDKWIDTINLTKKEWSAAKQYGNAYNIYRVYFTPTKVVVRKINNPFNKNENGIIDIVPTMYRLEFDVRNIDLEY